MKKLHTVLPPAADAKFVGDEPIWGEGDVTDKNYVKQMMRGLNWHNYVAKDSDLHKYLIQWASKHSVEHLKQIENLSTTRIVPTIAAIARMHLQGFPLRPHHLAQITDFIARECAPKERKTKVVTEVVAPKPNVQDSMRQQITGTLADIDFQIDKAFDEFSIDAPLVTDMILQKNYTSRHLSLIIKHITSQISEWTSAYNKEDDQLTAGYAFVPRRKFKQIIDGFGQVLEKIQQYSEKNKPIRKPRPINKVSVTKGLKFLKNFDWMEGQPTTSVVGATVLWIYDTKYRKLIRITGEKKGLSAKGSSIIGAVTAQSKMLRWPDEQLREFQRSKGKTADSWFDAIKTKTGDAGHRITKTMILLRVE